MNSKNGTENNQKKENPELSENSKDKIDTSISTETTEQTNIIPKSDLNKDNLENKEKKDSNNLNSAQKMNEIEQNTKNSDKNEKNDKKNEEFTKQIELMKEYKKDNYKKFYLKYKFCDFRTNEESKWKMGLINEVNDDFVIVSGIERKKSPKQIKIDDSEKLAYFRKYSVPSDDNFYSERESREFLMKRLKFLEDLIKKDSLLNSENDAWTIYYILHSKIFFGLDAAMKINDGGYNDDNDGVEESVRIILCILFFISKYFKYILDNKDEFINYQNNIVNNKDLMDLKIINKKYAFFSFFCESLNLLSKIFAYSENYLIWFKCFENEIKEFIPSNQDLDISTNKDYFPIYENQISQSENQKEKENKIVLKKMCLAQSYKFITTYTTSNIKIRAVIVAYFIDYFSAYNGFTYLFQICSCNKFLDLNTLLTFLNGFNYAKAMTNFYANSYTEEKKKMIEFAYSYIENLSEEKISEYEYNDIINFIQKISDLNKQNGESQKILENLYVSYYLKILLTSKKLDQQINALNIINDILKSINSNKKFYSTYNKNINIKEMTYEGFCAICKKNKILDILLSDKNIHEKIIEKLPKIIFVMYKFNFGYDIHQNKEKIESDKKLIFNALFDKLLESEQTNEKLAKNIRNIICEFCEYLSEEDKLYAYGEIKNYLIKSILKKGIPVKDHLSFVIDYSLQAIATKKNSSKNKRKNKRISEEEEDEGKKTKTYEEEKDNENEELSNLKLEEGDYYGLNLLMNYLKEEEYKKYNMTNEQKLELINESIEGIIKIMDNCNQKEYLLKYMILRARDAMTSSKDVIQFLILFEKIKENKEINISFNKISDEYSKKMEFLQLLMTDTEKYLSIVKKDDSNNNGEKIFDGLFNNELNIKLRLELIFDLLQKNLTKENLDNLKTKIINSCEENKFANDCLNKYIQRNLKNLDFKFIQYFYDNILATKEKISNVNDLQYYKLCTEIIKETNKVNKIFHFINNKDLAVINCEYEKEIKGMELLWNFLINTEMKVIRNDVTDFLADIFFGIKIKDKEKRNNYWTNFVKIIYDKLDEIIRKDKEEKCEDSNTSKSKYDQSINGIISLIKKIENKFTYEGDVINNISRIVDEISLNKIEKINKFEKEKGEIFRENNKKIYFSGKKYNSDDILNFDIKIENTDYFYMFRYKLSSLFKIPVNLIKVVVDENKYDPRIQGELKKFEFNMYDDFENTFSLLNDLEQAIYKDDDDIENHILIFRVEYLKENQNLAYIKKLIKDFPKLIELLKRKNSEYLIDIWCLIKEDCHNKINPKITQIIKDILNEEKAEQLNSIFNFQDTNIYYISYILFHLFNIIKQLKSDDMFIKEKFLKSQIWQEKIKNIQLEYSAHPQIGEIHEKNNVINYLLSIYKIISPKTNDTNTLLYILNKLIKYYYGIINECISINLKSLPSTEGFPVDLLEDLYISNTNLIKEIIINNKMIYDNFINILLSESNPDSENYIKNKFEFLLREGILKNKIYTINLKLQSFLITIADDNFFNQDKDKQKKFFLYLANYFFSEKSYEKLLNCIKSIALDKNIDICICIEKYENNIKLYFDIINNVIDKVFPLIYTNYDFKRYVNEIIIKHIFNPIIDGIPLDYLYHEMILGGFCKTLIHFLSKVNNYKELLNLNYNEEKKLKLYLFDEIIMNKCNQNIFTEKNIDNYRSISISTSYTIKAATNLFIFLLMQNIHEEDPTLIHHYFNKLTELHNQCFWKGNNISDWKLEYKDNNRLAPYVGLKNLGCTCYMNSLLQIFFNYIPFRESLLKCKCKEEKNNSLYQIKKVFYSLKYLQVNYYTPSDFPKNYDDEELNVHQQMDIDEFFGNILDKIENRLKGTNNENLVKYFFQGSQNDILTFQEGCTHHRTNTNIFYSIQLQIQNKKNIYESLDFLTKGELMNENNKIFCPKCNKKISAVKSQNFKTLPRMLIFVLKRFEFNYDTMKKVKINDYYEFPFELDMTKYISETKKDVDLNMYTLKSVVVHMGNCEGGHYYAFIKSEGEQWYEFNDTQVTPSNIESLKKEAFGGEETINNNGYKIKAEKDKSAYLLFYEKKVQTDCEKFDNIEAINSLNGNNNNEDNFKQDTQNENENENKITINDVKEEAENLIVEKNENIMSDIFDNINMEMFKHFLSKKLFSNEYQYFILELYLNVLNYFYSYDLPVFLKHLCRNPNNKEELREIQATTSNLNLYLNKKKLILFCPKKTMNKKVRINEEQILNIFKHFIQYFYNVMLRTKEKEFLGPMVDLIKFLIRDKTACANYLIEEFCNKNVIIEYLINCPLYEIKKLIVGILYCSMATSINDYELTSLKEENFKNKDNKNNKKIQNEKSIASVSTDEDEELARQLQQGNLNGNYIFNNPLEYNGIPRNILKLIYNMLHLIRSMGYDHMNEQRFLYYTIYRFSLINQNTREFLYNKCRVFELLCLLLHRSFATFSYPTKDIIQSTNIGPYTVTHDILNTKLKNDESIIVDKVGKYRIENYIYMLFFYLLSYTPKKYIGKVDEGYSLDNREFVRVLLNNIRTKQDAFCFSNYINEKCKNNKNRINTVLEALMEYLNKVDNNENTNYDFNNYNNFMNNDMNLNPLDNDPGMNPKYLLIIIKNFLLYANLKSEFVLKGVRNIFKVFWNNQKYYNFCIMIIDYITELFSSSLKGLVSSCKKDLDQMRNWLENNTISPSLYPIDGIYLYKYEKKSYFNVSSEKIKEFDEKEIMNTKKRIDKLTSILKNETNKNKIYENDIDLSDFKFIIGDVILYDGQESAIEEALDELLKITIDAHKKNGKKRGGVIDRKEIWIETDDPKIQFKELRGE